MHDVYLYGSTIVADSFILKGEFPKGNKYAEFIEHHCNVAGATGVCLSILSEYGIRCKTDGYHLGTYTAKMLNDYFKNRSIDISSMTVRNDFEGAHTYVWIDQVNNTRNSMGLFGTLQENEERLYNFPKEEDIQFAKCVAIDPFIIDGADLAAKYCTTHKIPYVTIDCNHNSFLAKNCEIAVISEEFLLSEYEGIDKESILEKYMSTGKGLYIFTFGAKTILYGRNGVIGRYKPFDVDVVSTWGAGDTFKCGCIYGLLNRMKDEQIVEFACALAGCACCVYPLIENIPSLDMVWQLIDERKNNT